MTFIIKPVVKILKKVAVPIFKSSAECMPVLTGSYGAARTCYKLYKEQDPRQALISGGKQLIIDCSAPVRYPVLCGSIAFCGIGFLVTKNPAFLAQAIDLAQLVLESND